MPDKQTDQHLVDRDQNTFSELTKEEWLQFAGKVLTIVPETDEILFVTDTETDAEAKLRGDDRLIEFFHVPPAESL